MESTIRQLRKAHKLSQAELAKMLNVHQTAVSQWEMGRTMPDVEILKKLSAIFGVSVDTLLNNSEISIDEQKNKPTLSKKDEHDIKNKIEDLLNMMSHEKGLMFDGDPMTPEALESIKNAMMLGMTAATLKNKEKYNPNKHKKAATDGRNGAGEKTDKKV